MAMLLCGTDSLRDVIAFPKNTSSTCPMSKAPTMVDNAAQEGNWESRSHIVKSNRINKVVEKMKAQGLDDLLITDPVSIDYLLEYENHPGERMYIMDLLPAMVSIVCSLIFFSM